MSGLSGDFGFSALDLVASYKKYKKKVLETWEGSWGWRECLLSPSLLGLSLGEQLSYFSTPHIDQEQLTVPAKTQPLSQEKGVTLPMGVSGSDSSGAEEKFIQCSEKPIAPWKAAHQASPGRCHVAGLCSL